MAFLLLRLISTEYFIIPEKTPEFLWWEKIVFVRQNHIYMSQIRTYVVTQTGTRDRVLCSPLDAGLQLPGDRERVETTSRWSRLSPLWAAGSTPAGHWPQGSATRPVNSSVLMVDSLMTSRNGRLARKT